jgi:hypothetical protein
MPCAVKLMVTLVWLEPGVVIGGWDEVGTGTDGDVHPRKIMSIPRKITGNNSLIKSNLFTFYLHFNNYPR